MDVIACCGARCKAAGATTRAQINTSDHFMRSIRGNTTVIVLAGITAFAFLGVVSFAAINANKALARDAQRLSDINVMRAALSLYSQKNNGFPVSSSPIALGTGNGNVLCSPSRDYTRQGGGPRDGFFPDAKSCDGEQIFLSSVPRNPRPNSAEYVYSATKDGTDYNIIFTLENNFGKLMRGQNCAKSAGITKC